MLSLHKRPIIATSRLCRAEELLRSARQICASELSNHSGLVTLLLNALDEVQLNLRGLDQDAIFDQFDSKKQLMDMLPTRADAKMTAQPCYPELALATDRT